MGGIPIIGPLISPPKPKAPPPPAPPPPAPTAVDPEVGESRKRQRRRTSLAAGATVLTSPQGLVTEASTTKKSLLGT